MKLQSNQVRLCCGGKGCPILSKEKNGIIKISDDYGGVIRIKESEAKLIQNALEKLDKE